MSRMLKHSWCTALLFLFYFFFTWGNLQQRHSALRLIRESYKLPYWIAVTESGADEILSEYWLLCDTQSRTANCILTTLRLLLTFTPPAIYIVRASRAARSLSKTVGLRSELWNIKVWDLLNVKGLWKNETFGGMPVCISFCSTLKRCCLF